jgi:hypothetical protein
MVELMMLTFDSSNTLQAADVSSEALAMADLLYIRLKSRLQIHIDKKVRPEHQTNTCLHWSKKNLAIVAAWMIVASQLKDITHLDNSKCLLASPTARQFLLCSNELSSRNGCYLYNDRNDGTWIRSGSATGVGGIAGRLTDHLRGAKSTTNPDDSRFYASYPSKESPRAESNHILGHFEMLDAYIGVYFPQVTSPGRFSAKDGLFEHTEDEAKWIESRNFSGKSKEDKYMQMAAYLFELGYDLALAPNNNVSDSPGFEGCGLRRKD